MTSAISNRSLSRVIRTGVRDVEATLEAVMARSATIPATMGSLPRGTTTDVCQFEDRAAALCMFAATALERLARYYERCCDLPAVICAALACLGDVFARVEGSADVAASLLGSRGGVWRCVCELTGRLASMAKLRVSSTAGALVAAVGDEERPNHSAEEATSGAAAADKCWEVRAFALALDAVANGAACVDQRFKSELGATGVVLECHDAILAISEKRVTTIRAGSNCPPAIVATFYRLLGNASFGSGRGSAAAEVKARWFAWVLSDTAREAAVLKLLDDCLDLGHLDTEGDVVDASSVLRERIHVARWAAHAVANVLYGDAPNDVQHWILRSEAASDDTGRVAHRPLVWARSSRVLEGLCDRLASHRQAEHQRAGHIEECAVLLIQAAKAVAALLEAWLNAVFRVGPPHHQYPNTRGAPNVAQAAFDLRRHLAATTVPNCTVADDIRSSAALVLRLCETDSKQVAASILPETSQRMIRQATLAARYIDRHMEYTQAQR